MSSHDALYELLKDMQIPPDFVEEEEEDRCDEDGNNCPILGESVAVTSEDTVCILIEVSTTLWDHLVQNETPSWACKPSVVCRWIFAVVYSMCTELQAYCCVCLCLFVCVRAVY